MVRQVGETQVPAQKFHKDLVGPISQPKYNRTDLQGTDVSTTGRHIQVELPYNSELRARACEASNMVFQKELFITYNV
jgi:hypothetical protein